jgi:xanthine dehydrogenase small subunit
VIISVAKVEALHHCERTDEGIFIGAAVSVEQAYRACLQEYPELAELADRFASLPVKIPVRSVAILRTVRPSVTPCPG